MARIKVLYKAIDPYYSDCEQTFIGSTLASCEEQMFEHNEWLGRNHPNGIHSIYETEFLTEGGIDMIENTFDSDCLICPYCGHKELVDFETFLSNNLECEEEHDCVECGRTFIASRSVIFCYETSVKKEE